MAISTPRPAAPPTFRPLVPGGLPIYRFDREPFAGFYAPGYLCVVPLEQVLAFEARLRPANGRDHARPEIAHKNGEPDWAARLLRRARAADQRFAFLREEPFRPECLTLYLNNECNLRCTYCYAEPTPGPAQRLDLETIAAAARVVAANCREKGRRLYAVFHGGGEPALHLGRLHRAVEQVQVAAQEYNVPTFFYIATNGVMPEENARWLARHFDLVGLSCDGPAAIHDRQRMRWDGSGSLCALERTARILREEGCRLNVRTTITQTTLRRQAEIAAYVCRQFEPEEIRVEPVYAGGRSAGESGLDLGMTEAYVTHFLNARAVAGSHGVSLVGSGSRPASVHGPYCNVYRQVLNVVPGSVATACFKLCDAAQVRRKGAQVGCMNSGTGVFQIQRDRVWGLRRQLDPPLPACAGCFNRYHCARDCPDRCPLDLSGKPFQDQVHGFRCQVQKATTSALLVAAAQSLWSEIQAGGARSPRGTAIV